MNNNLVIAIKTFLFQKFTQWDVELKITILSLIEHNVTSTIWKKRLIESGESNFYVQNCRVVSIAFKQFFKIKNKIQWLTKHYPTLYLQLQTIFQGENQHDFVNPETDQMIGKCAHTYVTGLTRIKNVKHLIIHNTIGIKSKSDNLVYFNGPLKTMIIIYPLAKLHSTLLFNLDS